MSSVPRSSSKLNHGATGLPRDGTTRAMGTEGTTNHRISPRNPITLTDSRVSLRSLIEDAKVLLAAIEKRRPTPTFKKPGPLKDDAQLFISELDQTLSILDQDAPHIAGLESQPIMKPRRDAVIKVTLTLCRTYRLSVIKPLSSVLRESEYRNVDYKPYIQVASFVQAKMKKAFAVLVEIPKAPDALGVTDENTLTPISESPRNPRSAPDALVVAGQSTSIPISEPPRNGPSSSSNAPGMTGENTLAPISESPRSGPPSAPDAPGVPGENTLTPMSESPRNGPPQALDVPGLTGENTLTPKSESPRDVPLPTQAVPGISGGNTLAPVSDSARNSPSSAPDAPGVTGEITSTPVSQIS